jgi:hypothetical protein
MKGKRINNLQELRQACEESRSVVVDRFYGWEKPKPAVFTLNQQGAVLLRMFNNGMFIYEKDGPIVDVEFKPKESEAVI